MIPVQAEKLDTLLNKLGISFKDINIYHIALTHTSYANENKHLLLAHNQRLEFLGDAVLELVVSDYLYNKFRGFPEGLLTKTRAAVVCEPSLAKVATEINLGTYLKIGRGEERSGGRKRPSLLADAFESLIGAVYLDQGMHIANEFILRLLAETIDQMAEKAGKIGDFKTELQETVQQKSDLTVTYTIIKEEGPDHDKTFTSSVALNHNTWGTGSGRTKKEAEQDAARQALEKIKIGIINLEKGRYNE